MIDNIERIQQEARSQIAAAPTTQDLDKLRVHYMGKKGLLTNLLHQLKDYDQDKRRELGAVLNQVKTDFESVFNRRQEELERVTIEAEIAKSEAIDVTLPGLFPQEVGTWHPLTLVAEEMVKIMRRIGYSIAHGPEVELEFFNFEALNTPADHPARDMQDTFYVEQPVLLRSHTSPMQIRTMLNQKPPLQIIALGKVYRADYDATHTPMFNQMEGLMVGEDISFGDLKGTLQYLIGHLFGNRPLRFRPSYFPFTEPSAEVDMQCFNCKGNGKECRLCKSTGWIEVGGCGMVHPNVFKAVNYDSEKYSGFAFGMGIERIAMLKYGVDDLRSFFENDYRMLEQF